MAEPLETPAPIPPDALDETQTAAAAVPRPRSRRHVLIIGGGFGGLACAEALGGAEIDVTIIDRRNHNLFQPLLYQVATAALSPADIAEPIRKSVGRYRNIEVLLAEVTGIDAERRQVMTADGASHAYDILVIATGSDYNYFGHDEWRRIAPGLKTLREARQIRQTLLSAFERAEASATDAEKRAALTTVIIGGGPTGVEMAGAVSELGRFMIKRDFRHLDPAHMRVMLVEAGPRLLSAFPEELSDYARDYLTRIGVEVLTGHRVTEISPDSVTIGSDRIPCGAVVWGAGIKASPAARWLGVEGDRIGRIPVTPELTLPGHPDVFVIGDTAFAKGEDGEPLPALAQVAKQQGQHVGRAIRESVHSGRPVPAFRFHNRGNTAVIGRNAAVFDFGTHRLKGRFAWFLWALVHVYLLINFEKRVLVSIQWLFRYLTRHRGARIIDERPDNVPLESERAVTEGR
jgi:NADH dehydrogenase